MKGPDMNSYSLTRILVGEAKKFDRLVQTFKLFLHGHIPIQCNSPWAINFCLF